MKIKLKCETCGKEFEREKKEVNRSRKLRRRDYCSLQCVGKDNVEHLAIYAGKYKLKPKRNDEYSPFRFHMRIVRMHCKQTEKRKKKIEYDITVQDLKEQWDKQHGVCPYTGWELKTPRNTNITTQLPKTPDRASLDRIDSSKGYTKDNIQFISMMAQFAKNSWPEDELFDFCEAVVENKKS